MKKSSKNKGFTLLEILAVIIVLAAITLITVPIVTNAVKSARKGSFKVSAQNLVKAADKYYGEHEFEMNKVVTFDFGKSDGKNETGEELSVSGKKPLSGKVVISKQGDIILADISDGTYYANYDSTFDDQVVVTETSEVLTRDELTQQLQDLQKKVTELEGKHKDDIDAHDKKIEQTNKNLAKVEATANTANNLATSLNNTRLDKTYPVGSIYISYSNTNPASLFGGTWESYGTGKTLVGVNTSDSNFNTVGKSGGAASRSITLSTSNLPSHTHSIPALSGSTASAGSHTHTFSGSTASAGAHTHSYSGTTSSNGSHTHSVLLRKVLGGSGSYSTIGFSDSYSTTGSTSVQSAGAHTHTFSGSTGSAGAHTHSYSGTTSSSGSHSHSLTTNSSTTGSAGSGTAFSVNTLQPYITVYMWRRTA